MEVNFDLHKYITVFNDVIPKKTLESFKKYVKILTNLKEHQYWVMTNLF